MTWTEDESWCLALPKNYILPLKVGSGDMISRWRSGWSRLWRKCSSERRQNSSSSRCMSGDSLWVRYIGESYRLASRSLSKPIRFLYPADLKAKSPKIKLQKEPTPSKGKRPDFGRPFTQVSCARALCPTRRSVRARCSSSVPHHIAWRSKENLHI